MCKTSAPGALLEYTPSPEVAGSDTARSLHRVATDLPHSCRMLIGILQCGRDRYGSCGGNPVASDNDLN